MKKNFRLLLSSLALLALGLVACNQNSVVKGTDYEHNNKQVTDVTLSSNDEKHDIGDTFQLNAEVTFRNDEEVEVFEQWMTSKSSVAKLTVDGRTALVEIVGSGTAYITFRAGYEMDKCKIYVPDSEVEPEPEPGPDEGETKITLSTTSRTIDVNGTFNLSATVSPIAEIAFNVSDSSILEITSSSENACVVKGLAAGNADVVVTAGDSTAYCHVSVLDSQEQGDKDYTIYFYIDYNNVDPKDNTKLLSKFDWYYDRPLIEAVKDDFDRPAIPVVTNDMALDPAFPYFIGWSTHPIIDTKDNLWDLTKDTVADLPMASYSVILYGQWMDVPVLPA